MFLQRLIHQRLPAASQRRLVLLTGARQVGKTTLVRAAYPHLPYHNLDEIEARQALRALPTRAWGPTLGNAIVDEAQKEPGVFEKLKFAFDSGAVDFSVLLGSSQVLRLQRVRESLAGRVWVYELWPLTLSEMMAEGGAVRFPLLHRLLTEAGSADDLLAGVPARLLGEAAHHAHMHLNYALQWGGMPTMLAVPPAERPDWLRSYTNTFVERDLPDIARLDDLELFRRFTRLAALRASQLLNYAELARDAGLSAPTVRAYLNHLALAYQTFTVLPYSANATTRLVKAPKLYWVDVGLWREQTGHWGEASGSLLENFVISEVWKWVRTLALNVELAFYRTHDGTEVDLLLTTPTGVWGLEIKRTQRPAPRDLSGLRHVAVKMGTAWRGGLLVCQCEGLTRLDQNMWAVPMAQLLG